MTYTPAQITFVVAFLALVVMTALATVGRWNHPLDFEDEDDEDEI